MGKNRSSTGKLVFNHIKKECAPSLRAWAKAEHQDGNALCTVTQSSRLWANTRTKHQLQSMSCFQELLGT